jgi:tRNA(fMet)-specific endonuclease VapC
MVRYVLDTDTVSLLQRAHPNVLSHIVAEPAGGVGITAITIEEQFLGWLTKSRSVKRATDIAHASLRLSEAVKLWARFPILPLTEPAILRFQSFVQLKLNVGRQDLRIAAVAQELGATVVTANGRDFGRVPGLSTVDWSA